MCKNLSLDSVNTQFVQRLTLNVYFQVDNTAIILIQVINRITLHFSEENVIDEHFL